ncbi:MAG: hypothetical protein AAFS11_01380 [Planctomycetota bacterium]
MTGDASLQPAVGGSRRAWAAGLGVGLATWVMLAVLGLLDVSPSRAVFDAETYHVVVVRAFASTWPAAHVSDYLSATTPGLHWLLAGVWQLLPSVAALEIACAGIAGVLVGALAWWVVRESRWSWGWVAALPVLASPYVVQSGTSVLPDNAGWLCVFAVLALCLRPPRGLTWIAVGIAMLTLVLTRQSHIWAAGVVVACGWLGSKCELIPRRDDLRQRLAATTAAAGAVVPAVGALAIFVWIWGGLVPPTFAGLTGEDYPNVRASLSLMAPAFILMLIGLYAPFFIGWWWQGLRGAQRRAALFGSAGCAIGIVLSLAGESTFSIEAGRHGGYWRLIESAPVIAGRYSVVLVALSALGGAMTGVCIAALPAHRRWLLLLALAGFASAQVVNANTWQRYYEPMVLMLVAVMSACCIRGASSSDSAASPDPAAIRVWRVVGPVVLALVLTGMTVFALAN